MDRENALFRELLDKMVLKAEEIDQGREDAVKKKLQRERLKLEQERQKMLEGSEKFLRPLWRWSQSLVLRPSQSLTPFSSALRTGQWMRVLLLT